MRMATLATAIEHTNDGWVCVHTDGFEIRVLMLTEDIVRIRAGFDGDFAERSYVLTATGWDDELDSLLGEDRVRLELPPTHLEHTPEGATLIGPRLRVQITSSPLSIQVLDADGNVVHADVPGVGFREDANRRRIHTSVIDPDDCFYGFGESTGPLNKHRRYLQLSPRDTMGYDALRTDPLYKHIPFYAKVNRRTQTATGFFYHTTHEAAFDMGKSHSNYFPHHSQAIVNGGDVDLFVIAGPAMRDVIARYTLLTGRPPILPRAALGYLASSMYYAELPRNCDERIVEFMDIARDLDFPVDGFQLSSGYTTQETSAGAKRCVFTWNDQRFPDPSGFFDAMRERSIVVSPNVKPGILDAHPRLHEFAEAGVFIGASDDEKRRTRVQRELHATIDDAVTDTAQGAWWGGPGRFVDFTNPAAREAWGRWLTEDVLNYGTSSVWNDNCEYDGLLDTDARCDLDGAGGTLAQIRPVLANLMCAVTRDAIAAADPQARPFIVCRSGHAGIQRFAQTWAGDNRTSWETLRGNIPTMLGMSISGVANNGCDIGGFNGPRPDPELFVRWVQHGIFQPRFSIHSVNTDNTVTEPWMYPEVTEHIREAIKLRYRLVPYLYSLMVRASLQGLPIIEPLVSAFPQDPAGYEADDVFMLGDSLLIATVLEAGATTRTVRFPAGADFYNVATGERYAGGSTVDLPVTLESIPVFVRTGGIVPLAVNQPMNLARDEVRTLRIMCAPQQDGSFVMREDDGATRAYEDGDYLETTITMRAGTTVHIDLERSGCYTSPVEHVVFDVFSESQAPISVRINGQELPHLLVLSQFEQATSGWRYDPARGSVIIKTPSTPQNMHVEISFDVFDMIGM